jgi:hypothetical protein
VGLAAGMGVRRVSSALINAAIWPASGSRCTTSWSRPSNHAGLTQSARASDQTARMVGLRDMPFSSSHTCDFVKSLASATSCKLMRLSLRVPRMRVANKSMSGPNARSTHRPRSSRGARRVAQALARIATISSADLGAGFLRGAQPGNHGPSSSPLPSGLWSPRLLASDTNSASVRALGDCRAPSPTVFQTLAEAR